MALAGKVVVGDAMAEGVVTVPQKASDVSWAEAIIIIDAAARADVNLKETIVKERRTRCRRCKEGSAVRCTIRATRIDCGMRQRGAVEYAGSDAGPSAGLRRAVVMAAQRASLDGTVRMVVVNGRAGGSVRVDVCVLGASMG